MIIFFTKCTRMILTKGTCQQFQLLHNKTWEANKYFENIYKTCSNDIDEKRQNKKLKREYQMSSEE